MKALISSLQENTLNRLKNPLIGAFVFSWTVWNSADLIVFILSDISMKISIVSGSKFDLKNDLFAPLGITGLYLLLIPVLNMLYERLIDGVINKQRNAFKQRSLQQHYYTVKETVVAKLDSDEDEIRKQRDRQLDKWAEEKQEMSEKMINAMRVLSERMAKIDSETNSYREQVTRLNREVFELETESTNYRNAINKLINEINTEIESLQEVVNLPSSVIDTTKKIKTLNLQAEKLVAGYIPKKRLGWSEAPLNFDDDIPF